VVEVHAIALSFAVGALVLEEFEQPKHMTLPVVLVRLPPVPLAPRYDVVLGVV
jgi:hypothetical protein